MAIRKLKSPFDSYVQHVGETAPHTEIVNRAKVSRSFQAIMGTERIMIPAIFKVSNESGPNGEEVFETDEADNRIRFVGSWANQSGSIGNLAISATVGSFIEVSFYGTGVNILTCFDTDPLDVRTTLDGGVESGDIMPTGSSILITRNYNANQILSLSSGGTLGWHTIKIRQNSAHAFRVYGFEILNESDDITVCAGKGHANGYEVSSDVDVVVGKYNTGFENVEDIDVGTKGGRVVVYTDPKDGITKKALTKVDDTAKYLTNTDHSNESVKRIINWREFGRNRADDFSTLVGSNSNRAFTLDDGTTTLVGSSVFNGATDELLANALNAYFTITFVGTGLDISWWSTGATGSLDQTEIFVDGVSQGFMSQSNPVPSTWKTEKICSGLPDGTHTIKFNNSVDSGDRYFGDFIIYQPKKPVIPSGAIVHGEYSLLADYVANTVANVNTMSTGVIRKQNTREWIYVGTGLTTAQSSATPSGFDININIINSYFEYTFFGTGFDFRFFSATATPATVQVTLDGAITDFSSYISSLYGDGSSSWVANTGVLDTTASTNTHGAGLVVSGLPLGLHTIRFEKINSGVFRVQAFDIITPIYNMDTYDGSMGIKDSRNFNPTKTLNRRTNREFESFLSYDQAIANGINKSKNISQVIPLSAGNCNVYLKRPYVDREIVATGSHGHEGGIQIHAGGTTTFKEKSVINVITNNSIGTNISTFFSINLKAELEQDFLEEGNE